MTKIIDGVELVEGKEMLTHRPSFLPVIHAFAEIIGDDKMDEYLKECLGEKAYFYPQYADVGMGESEGWASLEQQFELIQFISQKLSVRTGYNYKQWWGKYEHIICE